MDYVWEQVRVDHGTEFSLLNLAQQLLSGLRLNNSNRILVFQSTSRNNHRVERLWVEINQRVNYLFKSLLTRMEARNELNDVIKFCTSLLVLEVCSYALQNLV